MRSRHLYKAIFFWTFACLLIFSKQLTAQTDDNLDLEILGNKKDITIPFALENGFIVIDIYLNSLLPLRFILDTGAEHSIIIDKEITDYIGVDYGRDFDISGADLDSVLTAHLATGLNFRVANSLLAKNRNMMVLSQNYFHLERITGTHIHGIIGGDFLSRFIVEFDYKKQLIQLHDPQKFKLNRRLQQIPATFNRNRAFLHLPTSVNGLSANDRKLLLDTGASLYMLLYTAENDSSDIPQRVIPTPIASGLGGKLFGNVGRTKSITLGNQVLSNVITYFQNRPIDASRIQQQKGYEPRDGIIGNTLLRRFNLVIDYVNKKVYVKPNRNWKAPTSFDRSGLQIAVGGANLDRFIVIDVIPDSPAALAGIKVGDLLKYVNGKPSSLLSLGGIFNRLEGKVGRKIKMTVQRGQQMLSFEFRLKKLI